MFAMSPVNRLSMPTTEWPRSSSVSDRCDPMKPAAPVITMRIYELGHAVNSAEQGQPHDLDVETKRPVLDVVEVEFDALLERRVAAPAVDLRPARDAGLHLV